MTRPSNEHVLCGTCHGEWKRGQKDRGLPKLTEVIEKSTNLVTLTHLVEGEYCCICGQESVFLRFTCDPEIMPESWCRGCHGKIVMVVAMDASGCIGKDNKIPWRLKRDMKHFKDVTTGHTVVMGRKTWESIPSKFRPLPNRRNIVLTRNKDYVAEGAEVMHHVDDVVRTVQGDIYVIGGGEIYSLFTPRASEVIVTHVDTEVEGGDAWFLGIGQRDDWEETLDFTHKADEGNEHDFTVKRYRNI